MSNVTTSLLVALFALVPATAAAQGSLTGRIGDAATGRPLGEAEILVRGTDRRTLTTAEGRYRIAELPNGTWVVEIRRIGYRPVAIADVVIRTGRVTTVDHHLEPMPTELAELAALPSFFPASDAEPLSRIEFSGEEIRRAPGAAGDVSRIMQSLPSVAKVNDQSNGLIVRGGSPLENLILVDGIEIPNINHFPVQGSSGGPIGLLNVDLIGSVELAAGGFGAPYGDRLSSVLDIHLREGNRETLDAQLDLNFVGYGGVAEGPLAGGRGSWLVSARRSYLDLVIKTFETGTTVIPSYGDYQAKLVYDLSAAHRLSLLAVWADDRLTSDLATARDNDMLVFGGQDLLQGTTGLTWSAFWSDRLQSRTTLAFGHSRFDEDYFETASAGAPVFHNRSREGALRLRHGSDLRLAGGVTLSAGGDLARTRFRYDNAYGERIGPFGETLPALETEGVLTQTRGGGFASVSVAPAPSLSLTAGARVDRVSFSGTATVSPRAAVVLRAGERTTLSLAGGLYHQGLPPVLLAQDEAHRALPDARAVQLVAGVNHLPRENLRVSVEVYHKRASRLPVDPATPALLPVDELYQGFGFLTARETLLATGRSTSSGLEVVVQQKLSGRLYGLLGGAFFRSRYEAADGIRRDRVFDNRLLASAEGGLKLGGGWDVSARWLYGGGAPYTPLDLDASAAENRTILDADRINAERLPAYHSLNLRVDRDWQIGRTTLRSFISAWNVYNRTNVAQYFWNDRTREPSVITQWGLLPVFGIEWEF